MKVCLVKLFCGSTGTVQLLWNGLLQKDNFHQKPPYHVRCETPVLSCMSCVGCQSSAVLKMAWVLVIELFHTQPLGNTWSHICATSGFLYTCLPIKSSAQLCEYQRNGVTSTKSHHTMYSVKLLSYPAGHTWDVSHQQFRTWHGCW